MTSTSHSGAAEQSRPLTEKVLGYEQAMKQAVRSAADPPDWVPLAEFVAVDVFERVGPFLEVQDWPQYTEMLTQWASSIDSFETSIRRVSELPGSPGFVYYEIEERHRRGDHVNVVNSLTVFEFNADGKIRHLDVYLQKSA